MSSLRTFLSLTALALGLQIVLPVVAIGESERSELRRGEHETSSEREAPAPVDDGSKDKGRGNDKSTGEAPTTTTPGGSDKKSAAEEPSWPKSGEQGGKEGDQGSGSPGSGSDGSNRGRPEADKTFQVEPAEGEVKVKRGNEKSFNPFTGGGLPFGSTVDASNGFARLTAATGVPGATQSATFFDGVFKVMQSNAEAVPYTVLRLMGGNFSACGRAGAEVSAAASKRRVIRRLWGRGKGLFRTRGRYSSASVRGTTWLTEDRCDGTLTKVRRGVVRVCDFATRRYVNVRPGRSYLAKRRGPAVPPPVGEALCRARAS